MSRFMREGRWGTGTGYRAENFRPIPIPASLLVAMGLPVADVAGPSYAAGLGRGMVRSGSTANARPVGVPTSAINLSIEEQMKRAGVNIGGVEIDVGDHVLSAGSCSPDPCDPVPAPALTSCRGLLDLADNVAVTAVSGPCDAAHTDSQMFGRDSAPDIACEESFPPLGSASGGAEAVGYEGGVGGEREQLVPGSCYVRGASADRWAEVVEFAGQFGRVVDSTSWREDDTFTGWLRFEDAEKLNWMLEVMETSPCGFPDPISFEC